MLRATVAVQAALITLFARSPLEAAPARQRWRNDRGQATAEYALVLLGVAAVALLLLAWATRSGKLGELFDAVIDNLIGKVN
jgi:hypothetical protein